MSDILINIPFTELCKIEGIERELVVDVVEYGIVEPIGYVVDERVMEGRMVGQAEEGQWLFETRSIVWIQKAIRLHLDLDIDWIAVAMVIELLQQKSDLEKEFGIATRAYTKYHNDKNIDKNIKYDFNKSTEFALNELGNDGWELISVENVSPSGFDGMKFGANKVYNFKKEKK